MLRAMDKWLMGYLRSLWRRPSRVRGPQHLLFCIADHFEPFRGNAGPDEGARQAARAAVRDWVQSYTDAVRGLRDSDGRPPRHTFFYPQEEYDPACVEALADLCRGGLAEVEVHLHHRGDTAEGLSGKLSGLRDVLHAKHGLLGTDPAGRVRYGFVHGNWALCNSRPDGDWCGVNGELSVLARTGCYADFTFPSAPSPTQPRTVNAIYRAYDRPGRPRGHDRGMLCRAGKTPSASAADGSDGLMLIQGPLGLDWRRRKWGVLPRLDNAELSAANPPSPARLRRWTATRIHVVGRAEWVFVKVHTHGLVRPNRDILFGEQMRKTHQWMTFNMQLKGEWIVHYVCAREMFNIVSAAEAGCTGNPYDYVDFHIAPPPCGGTGEGRAIGAPGTPQKV